MLDHVNNLLHRNILFPVQCKKHIQVESPIKALAFSLVALIIMGISYCESRIFYYNNVIDPSLRKPLKI